MSALYSILYNTEDYKIPGRLSAGSPTWILTHPTLTMCIALISTAHPDYELILIDNRDV